MAAVHRYRVKDKSDRATVEQVRLAGRSFSFEKPCQTVDFMCTACLTAHMQTRLFLRETPNLIHEDFCTLNKPGANVCMPNSKQMLVIKKEKNNRA